VLHTLLQRAEIPGPYVLAGHSSVGLAVRVFAADYPAEVAGVMLIDSVAPGSRRKPLTGLRQLGPRLVARGLDSDGARRDNGAPRQGAQAAAPTSTGWLSIATLPARIGLMRLLAGPLDLKAGIASSPGR
jgi:pimeloyl-ACP methyl ester carboxylesterase